MYKKLLLAVLAAAALALVAPSMASAATGTPAPNLPPGIDPACIGDGTGECEHATIDFAGQLTTTSSAGIDITCQVTATITFHTDGTTDVTAFNFGTPCTTNLPGCFVHHIATNLDWGNRLGYSTSDGKYRDYINANISVIFTSGCPIVGTFSTTGTLSPTVDVSGGSASLTFGTGSGFLSGPLGNVTFDGTLTSTDGVGDDTELQLIPED